MYIDVYRCMCARTHTHRNDHTNTQTKIKKPDTSKQMCVRRTIANSTVANISGYTCEAHVNEYINVYIYISTFIEYTYVYICIYKYVKK